MLTLRELSVFFPEHGCRILLDSHLKRPYKCIIIFFPIGERLFSDWLKRLLVHLIGHQVTIGFHCSYGYSINRTRKLFSHQLALAAVSPFSLRCTKSPCSYSY